jgi:hypothetical protein
VSLPAQPEPHDHVALLAEPEYAAAWESVRAAVRGGDSLVVLSVWSEYERVRNELRAVALQFPLDAARG